MASSITADLPSPTSPNAFASPVETASGSCADEDGVKDSGAGSESSEVSFHRLSFDLPDIPDIPSPLMRPPKSGMQTVTTESNAHLLLSTASADRNDTGK